GLPGVWEGSFRGGFLFAGVGAILASAPVPVLGVRGGSAFHAGRAAACFGFPAAVLTHIACAVSWNRPIAVLYSVIVLQASMQVSSKPWISGAYMKPACTSAMTLFSSFIRAMRRSLTLFAAFSVR